MALLPLFPLPNVVLFPGVLLPLHIFEPRYRAMVADALEDDRRLGMVLLRTGWERDYEGRPAIYALGCSGVIVHAIQLDDGRYNIVLRGLDRFRVVSENHERPYRRAEVENALDPSLADDDRRALGELRARLEVRLGTLPRTSRESRATYAEHLAAMPDCDFVHTLAQYLDLEPLEKQALLECDSVRLRAETLVDLLEMKQLRGRARGPSNVSH